MDALPPEPIFAQVEQAAISPFVQAQYLPPVQNYKKGGREVNSDPEIQHIESALMGKVFELEVTERSISIGSSSYVIPTYAFKDQDSVYKQLIELAGTTKIRVFFPGTMGTQDYVADRVNFIFDDKGMFVRCSKG